MTDSEQLKEIYEHLKKADEEIKEAFKLMSDDDYNKNSKGFTKFQSQLENYVTEYMNRYGKSVMEKR